MPERSNQCLHCHGVVCAGSLVLQRGLGFPAFACQLPPGSFLFRCGGGSGWMVRGTGIQCVPWDHRRRRRSGTALQTLGISAPAGFMRQRPTEAASRWEGPLNQLVFTYVALACTGRLGTPKYQIDRLRYATGVLHMCSLPVGASLPPAWQHLRRNCHVHCACPGDHRTISHPT